MKRKLLQLQLLPFTGFLTLLSLFLIVGSFFSSLKGLFFLAGGPIAIGILWVCTAALLPDLSDKVRPFRRFSWAAFCLLPCYSIGVWGGENLSILSFPLLFFLGMIMKLRSRSLCFKPFFYAGIGRCIVFSDKCFLFLNALAFWIYLPVVFENAEAWAPGIFPHLLFRGQTDWILLLVGISLLHLAIVLWMHILMLGGKVCVNKKFNPKNLPSFLRQNNNFEIDFSD